MQRTMQFAVAMLVVVLLAASPAGAQPTSSASGTVVGTLGGAAVTWPITMSPSTNVTLSLAHWPCQTGGAVHLEVYGPSGLVTKSSEGDACTQKAVFNTVAGGSGSIKLLNYLDGVSVTYTLTADGVEVATVQAGSVPPEGADVEPPPVGVVTDTLLGNAGGAFENYTLEAEAGKTYVLDLSYSMTSGGSSWTGVGINVWAPNATRLAKSIETSPSSQRVFFTPTAKMTLSVQVFNYNSGQTMAFALMGLPGGQEN